MNKEQLELLTKSCSSKSEILIKLGLRAAGSNFETLNKYIKLYNLDTPCFRQPKDKTKNAIAFITIPIENILVENSTYNRGHLKSRLYKMNIKQRICELCGQDENWNGKKMSLILDHINGIHNDNRLENLQIVCANCNATLETFAGKNVKKKPKINKQKIKKIFTKKTKIVWPLKDELEKLVWEISTVQLAKKLGVSDSAIAKQCKKLNIVKPPRGYWEKLKHNRN